MAMEDEGYKAKMHLKPNRADLLEPNLGTVRSSTVLTGTNYDGSDGEGITILDKGTGTFSLILTFDDDTMVTLPSAKLKTGTELGIMFVSLKMTNAAQPAATDPTIWVSWRP